MVQHLQIDKHSQGQKSHDNLSGDKNRLDEIQYSFMIKTLKKLGI
jgi:hypothetical protein